MRRILLAPINAFSPLPVQLDEAAGRVFVELQGYLAAQEKSVQILERVALVRAALGAAASADSVSMELTELPAAAVRELAAGGRGQDAWQLLVIPDVVLRTAVLEHKSAHWDGVRRRQPGSGRATWSGTTNAASLRVRIYTPDGSRVFEGVGGLDLIFQPNIPESRMELVRDPLSNMRNLQEGIALAFHPFLGPGQ